MKHALSDIKEGKDKMDQVVKNLKTREEALKETKTNLKNVNIEKIAVEKKLDKLEKEMEIIKKKQVVEKLKCKVCDISFESSVFLTQHIREKHSRDQVCQTRQSVASVTIQTDEEATLDTWEYPCYYCDYVINSSEELKNHREDCSVCLGLDLGKDKCDQCDEKFEHRTELIDHYQNNHPDIFIIWCDFRQAGFDMLEDLRGHIRMEHTDYIPR